MALLSKDILNWIIDYIEERHLGAGDVLPAELEICDQLSVGRSTVREAFATLKAFGVARSQQGVGLILIADPRRLELMSLFTHDNLTKKEFQDVRQMRGFLELGSAQAMLQNVTRQDIKALDKLLRRVAGADEEALTPMEFEIEFHERLARLSGNQLVIALSLLYRPLYEEFAREFDPRHGEHMAETVIADHRLIVDALDRHDLDKLTEALRHHLHPQPGGDA